MSKAIKPIWNRFGPFCPACQEPLTQEDADFMDCPHCGGEEIDYDEEDEQQ